MFWTGRKFPRRRWIRLSANWRNWKNNILNTPVPILPLKESAESLWINSSKLFTKRGSGHSAMLSPKKKSENLTNESNECWRKKIFRPARFKISNQAGRKIFQVEYACELKIDGFKIVLTYEKGILQNGGHQRRRRNGRRCDPEHQDG